MISLTALCKDGITVYTFDHSFLRSIPKSRRVKQKCKISFFRKTSNGKLIMFNEKPIIMNLSISK